NIGALNGDRADHLLHTPERHGDRNYPLASLVQALAVDDLAAHGAALLFFESCRWPPRRQAQILHLPRGAAEPFSQVLIAGDRRLADLIVNNVAIGDELPVRVEHTNTRLPDARTRALGDRRQDTVQHQAHRGVVDVGVRIAL